jgi:UDP:flavonoid glycosyltransferase YjiC (YdhE family)
MFALHVLLSCSVGGDGHLLPVVAVARAVERAGHLAEAESVFRAVLDALAGPPARVRLTVGHATDPLDLAPVPVGTHIGRWVPQAAVLRRARVAVCHGGPGTTFGALAAGVPLVICPMFTV